ncbi:MAG: ATP-binding protein [Burkholderiales bacterium]
MQTTPHKARFALRLRGRYIALALGLAIVPLALIVLVLYRDVQARFEKQQDAMLQESIGLIAGNIANRFDSVLGQLRTLAGMTPVPDLALAQDGAGADMVDGANAKEGAQRYAALLREFGMNDHSILSLRLHSPEGVVWVREDFREGIGLVPEIRPVIDPSGDGAFQNARLLPQGTAFVSQLLPPRSLDAAEEAYVSIAMPLYREGRPRAVLVADMSAARIFNQTAGAANSNAFILADARGNYVPRIAARGPVRPVAASLFADWPGLDPRNLDTIQHSLSNGSAMLAKLIDVNPKGAASFWMIGAVKDDHVFAPMLRELASMAVQWVIVLGVLAVSAALLMADLINKPLAALVSAARRVRDGDMAARAPADRGDEIGDIARSFNAMLDSLQDHNQSLNDARERTEAQMRAKLEFFANVGHDIRTPLQGTLGALEMLSGMELNAEQRACLRAGTHSAEALDKVLNDVLDFSLAEAGKLSAEHVVFDLRRLAEECTAAFAVRAQEKKLQLLKFVPAEIPVQVTGDPTRIRRVLAHLLGNAIRFTRRGEVSLSLRARSEPGGRYIVRFEIKDTGAGMSDEERMNIISPGAAVALRHNDGRGLGTLVCRRLVELMKGEMGIDSKPGRGSTFWFEIPVRSADASVPLAPSRRGMGNIPASLMNPSHQGRGTSAAADPAASAREEK